MKTKTCFSLALLATLSFVLPLWGKNERSTSIPKITPDHWKILAPIKHQNLTIYPVVSPKSDQKQNYLTMDQGLKSKKVIITELGNRILTPEQQKMLAQLRKEKAELLREFGSYIQPRRIAYQQRYNNRNSARIPNRRVNAPNQRQRQVVQQNKAKSAKKLTEEQKKRLPQAKKRLLVISRKISVLAPSGGRVNFLSVVNQSKQDLYIMAGEMVIGGKQDRIVASNTLVPAGKTATIQVFCVEQGRWRHKTATFSSNAAIAHNKLRYYAQHSKSQSKVWKEVSRMNRAQKTTNTTETYQHNYTNKKVLAKLKTYTKAFHQILKQKNLVGFIVAIDSKFIGGDLFSHPSMFHSRRSKLLQAYCLEAMEPKPRVSKALPPTPTLKEAQTYLNSFFGSNLKVEKRQGDMVKVKMTSSGHMGFALVAAEKKGLGKILHLNLVKKMEK